MATATAADGSAAASRAVGNYRTSIRELGDRLVEAQRPIRILDAVRWEDDVEYAFFAAGARELPPVRRDYYATRPLPFDPDNKRQELLDLERDVRRRLGEQHGVGRILLRMSAEYRQVVEMLAARGTPQLVSLSERLYGGADDALADLGRRWLRQAAPAPREDELNGPAVVTVLRQRLTAFFGDDAVVCVRLSSGIVADAVAGGCCLKVRGDARLTARDVRLLEVHEGWVHLGTTLNARCQPVCTFLSKGPPSSTVTQEGLAVLTEVLSCASHPLRVRRLANRIEAVRRAAAGADFLDVYRFFVQDGYEPRQAYQAAVRVFRGSLPEGCGPFTKDLCYGKGFVRVSALLREAVRGGHGDRVTLLFCGKTSLDDLDALAALAEDGLLAPPRFLPPPFADAAALAGAVSRL